MKIFALCVVKNEGDIIEECLRSASLWADRIFVYDGQSTDDTWEKVVAMQNEKIVPWRQNGKVFQESLRAEIFNAYRHEAAEGDWWCSLDADEFYIHDPRAFLTAIPAWQHVVWGVAVEYYLTHGDIAQLDFTLPMRELLNSIRYYRAENAEPRFFRYRPDMIWSENDGWPRHMGIPAKERILFKHYKYRSPTQVQLRIDTRLSSQKRGYVVRPQYTSTHWEQEITDTADLDFDAQDGHYRLREDRLPQHLQPLAHTLIKRFLHGTGIWPALALNLTMDSSLSLFLT